MIGYFSYEFIHTTQEVQADDSGGAKANKISDGPTELLDEAKTQVNVVEYKENSLVRPIQIEHGPQVTKEDLIKYNWVLLYIGMDEEDIQTTVEQVHIFTDKKRKIITFDKQSGKALNELNRATGEELPPGEDPQILGYTMTGNEFREEFKLRDEILSTTSKAYWDDNKIIFTPFDEYDHKEERQTIFQPVEFVEENEYSKNK
ncbi:hypothetical protein ATZ33_06310 [Enterococcus silesiacus]|uniref:Uncharacterized protein n=1 Tax=Enterococcus silesiacus TaxID=332949 RepID=A0A0S3K9K4_9ENTE|nr:hypothetical protein ATZ33_06310 [Enterococcus silesiacus]OJG91783.1 hypothetical protein RV15_GL000450 [Enterococcus silesiacus]